MTAPTKHPLYEVWRTIKKRTEDPKYKDYPHYGGRRGCPVKMCPEWSSDYMLFYNWALSHGYRQGLTLDRVNNMKGYEPGNCQWATRKHQASNRGTNTRLHIRGEIHTISEWSEISGIKETTIVERLKRGWDPESAVFKDVCSHYKTG